MAVIRFPRKTKVLGTVYTVSSEAGLMIHSHETGGAQAELDSILDVLGLMDDTAQTIVLEKNQGPDRLKVTYLHEHLHAMFSAAGLRDTVDYDDEEKIVGRLAPIMLLFLKENPNVYTFLTGRYTYR